MTPERDLVSSVRILTTALQPDGTVLVAWEVLGVGVVPHVALHYDDESHPAPDVGFSDYHRGAIYPDNATRAPTSGYVLPGVFHAAIPPGVYARAFAIDASGMPGTLSDEIHAPAPAPEAPTPLPDPPADPSPDSEADTPAPPPLSEVIVVAPDEWAEGTLARARLTRVVEGSDGGRPVVNLTWEIQFHRNVSTIEWSARDTGSSLWPLDGHPAAPEEVPPTELQASRPGTLPHLRRAYVEVRSGSDVTTLYWDFSQR